MQIGRRCVPGLQAVIDAAMRVQTGAAELVLAGGAESMSQAKFYVTGMRWVRAPALELVDRLAYGRITAGRLHHPWPAG